MKIAIIVEGPFDQIFIQALLLDLIDEQNVIWVVARGKNAARPLARRYIIDGRTPVLLILDADTTDDETVEHEQNELENYLDWSGGRQASKVILFKPELEEVFFSSEKFVSRVFRGTKGEMLNSIAALSPKQALSMRPKIPAAGKPAVDLDSFYGLVAGKPLYITKDELAQMRLHPKVAEIREFVKSH